jgi:thiol:disulfide interchange protein DsbC
MKYLIFAFGFLISTALLAEEDIKAPASSGTLPVATDPVKSAIEKTLKKARPEFSVQQVEKTDIPGLYMVYMTNGLVLYSTASGNYVIEGSLYRVDDKQLVDVRDEKMKPLRAKLLSGIARNQMIIFPAADGNAKSYVTVFTDVDCPYCQKFHSNIAEYNKRGIEVRYVAFPRAGPNSVSAKKLMDAWCADDPREAITRLTQRQSVAEKNCDNPVASQYMLGEKIGVNGTPAVYAPDGTLVGGYVEPDQLSKMLGLM